MRRQRFLDLLPIVLLMWVYFLVRAHRIDDQMPYFIDELNHINRSRIIYTFTDLQVSTTPGKFLLYYWLGLFGLPYNLPGWLARTATVLLSVLGAAGTYALAKYLFARWAGWLAVALLCVFPFMTFHERMVLSDPLTASFVVIATWWSIIWAQKPTRRNSTILAAMICLMLLAKILAGPFIFMPIAAILFLSPLRIRLTQPLMPQLKTAWRTYRPAIWRVVWINAVIWGVIMVFYVGRGLLNPEDTRPIVDDYIFLAEDRASQLEQNLTHMRQMFTTMWGLALTALALLAIPFMLWRRLWQALYLLAAIVALWLPIFVIAARPNSRYLTLVAHIWLVLIAGGVYLWWESIKDRSSAVRMGLMAPVILLVGLALGNGASFARTLINEPTALDLPQAELNGYFRNFTGFAIRDAAHYIADDLPPISDNSDVPVAVGMIRACNFLHYHVPADLNATLLCFGDDTKVVDLARIFDEYGTVYAMWEQVDPPNRIVDKRWLKARMVWIKTFERPHDGIKVNVYIVYPQALPIGGIRISPTD